MKEERKKGRLNQAAVCYGGNGYLPCRRNNRNRRGNCARAGAQQNSRLLSRTEYSQHFNCSRLLASYRLNLRLYPGKQGG